MGAVLHPVGPRSSRVYWVRRLVVVLAVLALVALGVVVGRALTNGDAHAGADANSESEDATADDASDGAAEPGATDQDAAGQEDGVDGSGPTACDAATITLTLTADQQSYSAGQKPVFTVTITNTSSASCTIDAGEANREILITSGNDRIWSSTDCPSEPTERNLLLPAGGRDESAVTWQQVRSAPECPGDLSAPRPGTYQATATVAGVSSTAVVFQLAG